MKQQRREGRPGVLLVLVAAALLALMAGQIRFGPWSRTEGAILAVLSPILEGVRTAALWVGEGVSFVTGSDSPGRIRELERQVAEMGMELERTRDLALENGRLRALLGLKESVPIPSIAASVLSNSIRGTSKTCLIDRGSGDGVGPDMAVISSQGVVGRVRSVGPGVAKVQFLTDAASGVAVVVQRSRVQGVLTGRGGRVLKLRYVSGLDDVQPGDLLLTSGLDGIYPKGLPVGVVAEVGEGGADLLRDISVVPRVEFERLEEVLILLGRGLPAGGAEGGS